MSNCARLHGSTSRSGFLAVLFTVVLAVPAAMAGPISLQPGDVLISDAGSYEDGFVARILKVDPSGSSVNVIASSENSPLKYPEEVLQDGDAALLIADQGATADNGAVLRLDLATGAIVPLVSGTGVAGVTGMDFTAGTDLFLALPQAFTGAFPGALYKVSRDGSSRTLLATGPQGARWAWKVALESPSSLLYIDHGDNSIRRIASSGGQTFAVYTDGQLLGLEDFKRSADGTIFAAALDGAPPRVVKITPEGTITTLSQGGLLVQPTALAVLPGGDVLVSDYHSRGVVRVNGTNGAQSYFLPPGSLFTPSGINVVTASATPAQPATWGAIKGHYRR